MKSLINRNTEIDLSRHPCFNHEIKGKFGRIHLPVAPKCNMKCNYCDRKHDCVNESRPGVTSSVLSPKQAVDYMEKVLEKEPRITVAGIAGPGDAFATPEETLETLFLLRRKFPGIILCLASNGLNIGPYIPELAEIGVSHVTITVNSVDPEIGKNIYAWIRDGKVVFRGLQGAEMLLKRQQKAITKLKERGIVVKVNTIVIPGINDHHITDIAKTMNKLGVDLLNCMAMFPNAGTPFGSIPQPDKAMMARIRDMAERYLPQMRHCTRCRADAVGLLDNDKSHEFMGCLSACSNSSPTGETGKKYVAVATREGILVNQHLGEAEKFQIWGGNEDGYQLLEERTAPKRGGGVQRWHQLCRILHDCKAILVSGIGETPREILYKSGIKPVEMNGFIEAGLKALDIGKDMGVFRVRHNSCGQRSCSRGGSGCM